MRSNLEEFKFCPNCGEKRGVYIIKSPLMSSKSVDADKLLRRRRNNNEEFDSDGINENDSELNVFVKNEQKEMDLILNEMKFEDDQQMRELEAEQKELNKLNKSDYIKRFDDYPFSDNERYNKDRISNESNISSSSSPASVTRPHFHKSQSGDISVYNNMNVHSNVHDKIHDN